MSREHQISIEAAVDGVLRSIAVSSDRQVESHLSGAEKGVANELGIDYRIVEVDGQTATDRGELPEVPPSGDLTRKVSTEYARVNEPAQRVEIEYGLLPDGDIGGLPRQPLREAMMSELANEDASLVMLQQTPCPTSPSQSPTTASFFDSGHSGTCSAAKNETEVDSTSIISFSGSTPDNMEIVPNNNMSTTDYSRKSDAPDLPEFETITTPLLRDDYFYTYSKPTLEGTVRRRIMRAVEVVPIGGCVICVCHDVNPIAEIELVAIALNMPIVTIDLGVKLRLRPKPAVFAEQFKAAMYEGAWFVLVNAHKSIATCRVLEELLKEVESRNFEGISPNARVIICMEPHPHFPKFLLKRAEATRIQSCLSESGSEHSMAASISRNRLVTAGSWCTRKSPDLSVLTTSGRPLGIPAKRRSVRINASVDVVDIAPREAVVMNRERPLHNQGTIALCSASTGVPGDKFLCVVSAGVEGRFAVGSSMGNVYFLDELGNSLIQAHTHESAIWDISFKGKYEFATGCEDGNAVEWAFETGDADGAALSPSSSVSLGTDVYCLTYLHGDSASPLLVGGLSHSLILCSKKKEVQRLSISSNAQVMDCIPEEPTVLVGGSNGSLTAVDVISGAIVTSFKEHSCKLPAVTVRDTNQFFTGSFDGTILSWDYRAPPRPTGNPAMGDLPTASLRHTLKLRNYVTGLHIDDLHLAANVGESLYLWDVRNLREVLGGYPQAWEGLSRGVRVTSASRCVVTASQDGYVRFWSFV
ncbi:hypothetical protein TRSC58_02231 [Trypanosoma rangeli SC58]|uniref:Uncharacterized protein n=1 Tax=Trypanosoma rangeli SC58 TaxID=429131 RepID=A0A061J7G8_TRYRA|nr:hypothetical protein TRSC58_02231 [Trypanosoma rangeli SC58]